MTQTFHLGFYLSKEMKTYVYAKAHTRVFIATLSLFENGRDPVSDPVAKTRHSQCWARFNYLTGELDPTSCN